MPPVLYSEEHHPQIVIYGKRGHAEVLGLVGQTNGEAIVIEGVEEAAKLNYAQNIALFSQTTKPLEGFRQIVDYITQHIQSPAEFRYFDTICRQFYANPLCIAGTGRRAHIKCEFLFLCIFCSVYNFLLFGLAAPQNSILRRNCPKY